MCSLGPADKMPWATWYKRWEKWMADYIPQVDYKVVYDHPEVQWARHVFAQPQTMMHARTLYDRTLETKDEKTGKILQRGGFTVRRFLRDLEERHGGIDSVLLWPGYPNIGADNRNLFQMYHDSCGGREGHWCRKLVDEFHEHNVKVLFAIQPWDYGTSRVRTEDGKTSGTKEDDWHAKAWGEFLRETNADGINGDTRQFWPRHAFDQIVKANHGRVPALEPEKQLSEVGDEVNEDCHWGKWGFSCKGPGDLSLHTGGWRYMDPGGGAGNGCAITAKLTAPRAYGQKAITNGKWHGAICQRWANRCRGKAILEVFWNGLAYESWETVWQIVNLIGPREGELLRRHSSILRFFKDVVTNPYRSTDANFRKWRWRPYVPVIFSSGGTGDENSRDKQLAHASEFSTVQHRLWLFINYEDENVDGFDRVPEFVLKGLDMTGLAGSGGKRKPVFVDAYRGKVLSRADYTVAGEEARVKRFPVERNGLSALLLYFGDENAPKKLEKCLKKMQLVTERPLWDFAETPAWFPVTQHMTTANQQSCPGWADAAYRSRYEERAGARVLEVSGSGEVGYNWFRFHMCGRMIEGTYYAADRWKKETIDLSVRPDVVGKGLQHAGFGEQLPWEAVPQLQHAAHLYVKPFLMHETLVTNQMFQKFIEESGEFADMLLVQPRSATGPDGVEDADTIFLRHWTRKVKARDEVRRTFAKGAEKQPVRWVTPWEAQKFCRFYNMRLPHMWEWMYAARGLHEAQAASDPEKFLETEADWYTAPEQHTDTPFFDHEDAMSSVRVDAFKDKAPKTGVRNLFQFLWQWSDVFEDKWMSRAAVLGGSFYRAAKCWWCLPRIDQVEEYNSFLVGPPGVSRSAMISFRCVADFVAETPARRKKAKEDIPHCRTKVCDVFGGGQRQVCAKCEDGYVLDEDVVERGSGGGARRSSCVKESEHEIRKESDGREEQKQSWGWRGAPGGDRREGSGTGDGEKKPGYSSSRRGGGGSYGDDDEDKRDKLHQSSCGTCEKKVENHPCCSSS
eukprot:g12004.t1